MADAKSMTVRLDWDGDLRFSGAAGDSPIALDGDCETAASPVQMLATALAGCMAIDVVHILGKMRTPAQRLHTELTVARADADPRRVVAATMKFTVHGEVPTKNIARALEMSRETYCSVWHSLRRDIDLELDFERIAG